MCDRISGALCCVVSSISSVSGSFWRLHGSTVCVSVSAGTCTLSPIVTMPVTFRNVAVSARTAGACAIVLCAACVVSPGGGCGARVAWAPSCATPVVPVLLSVSPVFCSTQAAAFYSPLASRSVGSTSEAPACATPAVPAMLELLLPCALSLSWCLITLLETLHGWW